MPTGTRKPARNKTLLIKVNFDARATPLGLKTIADMARFVGLEGRESTFHRVYSGTRGAGGTVVDLILNAPWPEPVTFNDFFRTEAA